ncbi:MAG: tRNA (adenosine(37)-N6)-threonylcarbamoyltransferase complex ATPase subunit type 1 TsaE [Verrucomicrobia bacterium]|nr:tRNA (adenosine(37)-N6)-threonylcarbamoyltransferase complex ATPase subunit type 1 TsaE [Verrucomicrobiota bacterium]
MANRNPICDGIFTAQGVVCASGEETRALGRALAEAIATDATLSLEGPLGAGKTCFVQGLAEGLGLDPAMVSSPTFTLVHEYPGGRLPLIHFDLYRLNSEEELAGLGYEDYFQSPGIRAIEWGDKFPAALPAAAWQIRLSIEGETRRVRGTR